MELSRAVLALHNQGIVHTFLVPRQILWKKKDDNPNRLEGVFTIGGFAYARHLDARGNEAGKDIANEDPWFRAPECRENRSHVAFGYAADIYSIGAILLFLATRDGQTQRPESSGSKSVDGGILTALRTPPTDNRLLKKLVTAAVNAKRSDLIKENENILTIIETCLRYDATDRFSCVEELIESIAIAIRSRLTSDSANDQSRPSQNVPLSSESPVLQSVSAFLEADSQHLPLYGDRDRIVTGLCALLALFGTDYCYRTMSLPDYWRDENLGSAGRFLTMNKHIARHLARIERLFLVSKDFHQLPDEIQTVLEAQLEAEKSVPTTSGQPHRGIEIRVLEVREEQIVEFERNGELVAYLEKTGQDDNTQTVCLNFLSTVDEEWSVGVKSVRQTIQQVRFWKPKQMKREKQFKDASDKFTRNWRDAMSLSMYVESGLSSQHKQVGIRKITLEGLIGCEEPLTGN